MKPRSIFQLLVLPLSLIASTGVQAASYIEDFTVAGTSNVGHNGVGWQAHIGTGGTDNSANTTNAGGFVVVPSDYAAKANNSPIGLAWTNEFAAFDRSVEEITTLSFVSNNNNNVGTMRFAVQIGTTWYATNQTFTHAGGGAASTWATTGEIETFNFTTVAAAWRMLNFTPNSTLSLGAVLSSDLPSGNLNAAGILIEGNTDIVRYDNFQINQVPEPSAAVLSSLSLLGLAVRRKR